MPRLETFPRNGVRMQRGRARPLHQYCFAQLVAYPEAFGSHEGIMHMCRVSSLLSSAIVVNHPRKLEIRKHRPLYIRKKGKTKILAKSSYLWQFMLFCDELLFNLMAVSIFFSSQTTPLKPSNKFEGKHSMHTMLSLF